MSETVKCPECGERVKVALLVVDVAKRRIAGRARAAGITAEERRVWGQRGGAAGALERVQELKREAVGRVGVCAKCAGPPLCGVPPSPPCACACHPENREEPTP